MHSEKRPLSEVITLLDELERRVHALHTENKDLHYQINTLRTQYDTSQQELSRARAELDNKQVELDVFSGVSDNERLALKQQVNAYISRIDQILENA